MRTEFKRLESCQVHGGKLLVFGDMHFSSSFSGQHKNYTRECYYNMDKIVSLVKDSNASAVIFLGDLVGVNEKNIKDRQFLMRMLQFFEMLNSLTNKNVYSVKGNHDMGDFTDFDLLEGLGLIRNPQYIDYYGISSNSSRESFEIRFHLVNYGDEKKQLKLAGASEEATDVVLGHNDFYIEGVTNWYSKGSEVELAKLDNFQGVAMVFSGHIHTPSEEILSTMLKNGESISLFFTGSPARVAERFDDCWYLAFNYEKNPSTKAWETTFNSEFMGLEKVDEVFYPKEEFVDDEDVADDVALRVSKAEKLTDIVKEIIDGRIMTGDLYHQIDIMPGVNDRVKNIAKSYLEKATKG